jgi:hypothetical protein
LLTEVEARAGMLRFVHVLVARAVYAGLPRGRRRRLHAQAAQVRHWAITAGDYAAGQLSPGDAPVMRR